MSEELRPGPEQRPREIEVSPETKEWAERLIGEITENRDTYLALADPEAGFSIVSIMEATGDERLFPQLSIEERQALITLLQETELIQKGNISMRVDEDKDRNPTDIVFAAPVERDEVVEEAAPEAAIELTETTAGLQETTLRSVEETLRNVRSLEFLPRHPYGGVKRLSEQSGQEREALETGLRQSVLSPELQEILKRYLGDPDSGFWASDILRSFPDLPQQAKEALFTSLTNSEAVRNGELVVWAYLDREGNMLNIVLKPPESPARWKTKRRTVLTFTALVDAPPEERGKCEICGTDIITRAPVPGGKPKTEDRDYPEFVPCPKRCLSKRPDSPVPLKYQVTYRPEANQ